MKMERHSGRATANLLRPLPVDFQDQVLAAGERRFHLAAGGAVVIVEDPRVLEKLAAPDHRFELVLRDEEVIATVGLGRPLRARRV